jgi:hypothetical protein
MPYPLMLVVVPGVFWLVAVGCGLVAWRMHPSPMFSLLREQLVADIDLLNSVGRS